MIRSTDGGVTWSVRSYEDYARWQGWFSHDVAVSPSDPDHVMAVPSLRKLCPGATVAASKIAAGTLGFEKAVAFFTKMDDAVSEALIQAGAIEERHRREPMDEPTIAVDRVIAEGDTIKLVELRPEQHFTEPPPRFTEASLVKTLEEYGIGRPSTYASIIATLKNREYVEMDAKRFIPTDIGRIVNGFLTDHFTQYVDYDFTARLEDDLDAVSLGEKEWVPLLDNFWRPFKDLCDDKEESVTREQVAQARELGTDPKSGKPVTVRMGRYGPFVQIGTKDDEEKPKFAGLRPGQSVETITLEEALHIFSQPKVYKRGGGNMAAKGPLREFGTDPVSDRPVVAKDGRFGVYVTDGETNASLRVADSVDTITLDRAVELLAERRAKGPAPKRKRKNA